jgi:hypothetical protein
MGSAVSRKIYLLALLLGAAMTVWFLPPWALAGGAPPGGPPSTDFAQQIVGQRYFLTAPWHLPVLVVPELMAPWGVNVAFTDSNPLALLLAKLFRPVLPAFIQVATLWLALCWLLQPAAAVFALRSVGERRLLPAVVAALMAASQPVFLARFMHTSLCSHFAVLVMIGLYFRAVAGSLTALRLGCLALPVLLLVHPYLAVMNAAVLCAVPLTLAWRRDRAWCRAAQYFALSCFAVIIMAVAFGYTEGASPGGYGVFSMNLLAPFYPVESALMPSLKMAAIVGHPGQEESYAYLGVGLLLLILLTILAVPRRLAPLLNRHLGLALVCAVLIAVALSHRVYFGHHLILRVRTAVGPLQMVRASGRLFWPVTYALLIGSVTMLSRYRPRLAMVALPLAAALQFIDTATLRAVDSARLTDPQPWTFDAARMRTLTASATHLTVLPVFGCMPPHDGALMQVLSIGAESLLPTNTMYVARKVHAQSCDMTDALADPPAPGDLLVVQPGFASALAHRLWARDLCRGLSEYSVCTQDVAKLAGLPPIATLPNH